MNIDDFTFAGSSLSSKGFMVCYFDSDSGFTTTDGSDMTLNYVSRVGGRDNILASVTYGDNISLEIDICKTTSGVGEYLSHTDYCSVIDWLCKEEPDWIRFKFDSEETNSPYVLLRGNFNYKVVEHKGKVVGFKLTFKSDSPFAKLDKITYTSDSTTEFSTQKINYSFGKIYPDELKITAITSGDISITNSVDSKITQIKNCIAGEVITLDCRNKVVTSNKQSHQTLYDDFNYNFPIIYCDRTTTFSCNTSIGYTLTLYPNTKLIV